MNDKYEIITEKELGDLQSNALLLKHKKTGARVFVMQNDDDNKVFYIGFRTPPEDSTGVAHIIEHTVLCGSKKYPLKDPFIELAKGSLNTFLNAMTYPDKTVYPIASRNQKDFKNLMDVYLDAVLNPNIYEYEEIFKQEGWHYYLENTEDEISYNGVVYNEMKGAFSSPESVLDRKILNSLFPDTSYGVESGGDPDHIPELTYESYLDFHRRYYHPSNSYIYLYGDMDVDERLEYLDREYLSKYDSLDIDSKLKRQAPFSEMRRIEAGYPISEEEDEKENTYLAYNLVCGDNLDAKQYIAMQMILYALVGTQGAPVRQRLLDEGIGKDVLPSYDSGVLQPYFSIVTKNAEADQAEEFLKIINEEFVKARDEGLNRDSLIASLYSMKFRYKEADYGGYPKGLIYGLLCLDSWIYDDEAVLMHLDAGRTYDALEKDLEGNYFEELVDKYLINNDHSSLLILKPEKGLMAKKEQHIADKLSEYKKSLSEDEIEKLIDSTKKLMEFQEAESTKEELETIPLLGREDIKRETDEFSNIEKEVSGYPVIWHDHFTNGIAYIDIFFNANDTTKDMLPYMALLKPILSFVDTKRHTYAELNNEINTYSGGLIAGSSVFTHRYDPKLFKLYEFISARTLYENLDKTMDLLEEVLFEGIYSDEKRLYEIIAEQKSQLQMSLNSQGHTAAAMRASSYYSESSCLKENMDGIEYYRFIENLEKNFDSEKDKLIENLENLVKKLIMNNDIIVSFTGDEQGYRLVEKRLERFFENLHQARTEINGEYTPVPVYYDFANSGLKLEKKNEAFKTSGGVQYVARAGRYLDEGDAYSGISAVFRTIMNYEYLWFNIRVQGGAYGCMSRTTSYGDSVFVTYRDPNLKRSNDIFEAIPEYLENFDVDEREMQKFVIGTMSGIDAPLTPMAKGIRDFGMYFMNVDVQDVQKARNEIIDARCEDIRALAPQIKKALSEGNICVIGNEAKIEEDKELFKEITNLFS